MRRFRVRVRTVMLALAGLAIIMGGLAQARAWRLRHFGEQWAIAEIQRSGGKIYRESELEGLFAPTKDQTIRAVDVTSGLVDDDALRHLGVLTRLTWLSLPGTQITDVTLERLR